MQMTAPDSLINIEAIGEMCLIAASTPFWGCFVEVGVYKGGSAWHLAATARRQGRALHLFDTFTGIPFKGILDDHEVGDFSDCAAQAVRDAIPDAYVHVGVFPATIMAIGLDDIAFVHVDCDQYRSVKDCISYLWPRLICGGVMLFDDWQCTRGATRAIEDALASEEAKFTKANKLYVRKTS